MAMTLKAAAEAVGMNKVTILRAIQKGKISASKDEHGEWQIDPAELHRVYPPAEQRTDSKTEQRYTVAALEAEIAGLKAVNELLRQEVDRWHNAATAAQARLVAPPAPPATHPWWKLRRAG